MPDFAEARQRMVERQLLGRGIENPRLLQAMREVPRHEFVSPDLADFAYDDSPLPIEAGQTISQPYIVAMMIDQAEVAPGGSVLEIGAGSGYAAAVMGRIADRVIAVERHGELARIANRRLRDFGFFNVRIVEGDGTLGWPDGAPYDSILVAASFREIPGALKAQLAPGGVLVMPVGGQSSIQHLIRLRRREDGSFDEEDLGAVRFVPLIGAQGWSGADD